MILLTGQKVFAGAVTDAYVKHGAEHDKGFECDGYNTDIGKLI